MRLLCVQGLVIDPLDKTKIANAPVASSSNYLPIHFESDLARQLGEEIRTR